MGERQRNKTEQVSRFGANVPCGFISTTTKNLVPFSMEHIYCCHDTMSVGAFGALAVFREIFRM